MAESAIFLWEGTDKQGRKAKGEITSASPTIARAARAVFPETSPTLVLIWVRAIRVVSCMRKR